MNGFREAKSRKPRRLNEKKRRSQKKAAEKLNSRKRRRLVRMRRALKKQRWRQDRFYNTVARGLHETAGQTNLNLYQGALVE